MTKTATAPQTTKTDTTVWVGRNGEVVCSTHGGYYLQTAVENAPEKLHHFTPLNDWMAYPASHDVTCEVC